MIGVPHAAASNNRTLGDQSAEIIAARVMFSESVSKNSACSDGRTCSIR
jgi:hypothetical protein